MVIRELQESVRDLKNRIEVTNRENAGLKQDNAYFDSRLRETTRAYNIIAEKLCRARMVIDSARFDNIMTATGALGEIKGIFNLEYPECPHDHYHWTEDADKTWRLMRHMIFDSCRLRADGEIRSLVARPNQEKNP